MYNKSLKAFIVAFVLASGFGVGTDAFASASSVASPETSQADGSKIVTGTVTDTSGETLIGLTVKAVGTSAATATDFEGNYSIKVPAGARELEFSYVGYRTKKATIKGNTLSVVMESDDELLDEVVVTAMGIQRKESSLTYATQELKGEELMRVQDANFVNSLQGKAAGVTITQSAGGAGGASKILLRGNRSITGNNQPLIVVDGIPMTNQVGGAGAAWSDSQIGSTSKTAEGGDALSLINPDDIESINILKGANAAALYGSAAANGVLMITTKKGKEGKITVTVNSNTTFETPLILPQIQNTYGATVGENASGYTIGASSWGARIAGLSDDQLAFQTADGNNVRLRRTAKDDISDFFGVGATYNNSISISGGTEKVRSYFSYANSYADGMVPNNSYQRNTFNFRQSYSLFKNKLKIDVALNYVQAKTKNRLGGGLDLNPLYYLYTMPRNVDMDYYKQNYKVNGTWNSELTEVMVNNQAVQSQAVLQGEKQQWYQYGNGHNNPYWLVNQNRDESTEERAYGYITAAYEIIDGLKIQARLNLDHAKVTGFGEQHATTYTAGGQVGNGWGRYFNKKVWSNDLYADALLSYNKEIQDFSVSATLGGSLHTVKGESENIDATATRFSMTQYKRGELPTEVNFFEPTASWLGSPNGFSKSSDWDRGLFVTAQLGYKDYVYVEGSYRQDWYRAFKQFAYRGTPDNYGYFSVGANTLMHRYIKMPEWITHLKLRASYSEVGNSIPNIVFSTVSVNSSTGAASGSGYGSYDNPIPETSKSIEAGFDVSFFQNTLNWDLTYYNTALCNSYFTASMGGKTIPVNTGLVRNQGIETTLSYSLYFAKDWMWRTSANFSYNDNKIEETYTKDGISYPLEQKITADGIIVKYVAGGSYGDIYTKKFKTDANGNIVLNANGSPEKEREYTKVGNMNSKFQLGWGNTLTWKDFSLYFLISGRIGGKVISLTETYLDYMGVSERVGEARLRAEQEGLVYTTKLGDKKPAMYLPNGQLVPIEEYYRAASGSGKSPVATEYMYDATNFRLAELSLGYTFRNLGNGAIKALSISAVGRNLFFIYNSAPIDPDISLSTANGLGAFDVFNMPATRSFGINLKLEF